MKVWVVIKVSPNFCECETSCNCISNEREVHKIFSTLGKAKKFVKDHPKTWRMGSYFEVENQGMEVENA
jgi:hypothetical protein